MLGVLLAFALRLTSAAAPVCWVAGVAAFVALLAVHTAVQAAAFARADRTQRRAGQPGASPGG